MILFLNLLQIAFDLPGVYSGGLPFPIKESALMLVFATFRTVGGPARVQVQIRILFDQGHVDGSRATVVFLTYSLAIVNSDLLLFGRIHDVKYFMLPLHFILVDVEIM